MDVAETVFLVIDAITNLVVLLTSKPFIDLNIITTGHNSSAGTASPVSVMHATTSGWFKGQ